MSNAEDQDYQENVIEDAPSSDVEEKHSSSQEETIKEEEEDEEQVTPKKSHKRTPFHIGSSDGKLLHIRGSNIRGFYILSHFFKNSFVILCNQRRKRRIGLLDW